MNQPEGAWQLSSASDQRLENLDTICLRGLRTVVVVGVGDAEREFAQPIELDVDVYGDFSTAARSDDIAAAVDYGALCDRAVEICQQTQARLLERLAHLVADDLVTTPGVIAADVTVTKLRPPVPHELESAAVRARAWAS